MRRIVEIPQTNTNPAYRRPPTPGPKSKKCEGCNRYKISAIPRKNPYNNIKAVLCSLCCADRLTEARLAAQRNR